MILNLLLTCFGLHVAAGAESIEDQARDLETRLIAPCCWRQPVSEHLSGDSDRIKGEIRLLLSQGRSRDQIIDHYVQQYGQAILSRPPYQGFYLAAYLLPPLFLAGLGWGLYWFLERNRRAPAATASAPAHPGHPYAAQLARQLRELDE